MKRHPRWISLLVAALILNGCASGGGVDSERIKNQTENTIILTGIAYDAIMTALGERYKTAQKEIVALEAAGRQAEATSLRASSEATRATAVEWANKFREAALLLASGVSGPDYDARILQLNDALAQLRSILNRPTIGSERFHLPNNRLIVVLEVAS